MPGQQGVLELGQHGVVEAEDALHERLAPGDAGGGVAAELLVDRRRLPARGPELAEGGGEVGRGVGREGRAHGAEPRPVRTPVARGGSECPDGSASAPDDTRRWRSAGGSAPPSSAPTPRRVRTASRGRSRGSGATAPPRWKDDQPSEPGSVAAPLGGVRTAAARPGRCEVSGVAARAVTVESADGRRTTSV